MADCRNVIITYPLGGGYVLFSPLFLTALSLSLSLSLSVCHFIPSFWNNSATVREGVTKFEMPRQKLLNKCLFLFIAPFDLWPLPWHECANLCCDHDNWRKIAWIAPKFACRLSFTQGSDKFENQFGRTSTFKMAADLKKMACAIFFQNAVTPEIMVGIAPYLVHRGTLGAPSTFLVLALVWRHVTFLWPYPFYKLFCVSAH